MLKKRGLIFLVVLIAFISNFVHAQVNEEGDFFNDRSSSFDPDDFNYKSDPLQNVPSDQLDPTKVKEFSREQDLTVEHLTHQNQDGTYNIDQFDANTLDPNTRDEALKQLGRTTKVQTETGNQNTKITTFDDGWSIDQIYSLGIDGITIANGKGITYRNNNLTVEQADVMEVFDGSLHQVSDFEGNAVFFNIGHAIQFKNRCVSAHNLTQSGVRLDFTKIEITPKANDTIALSDCSGKETLFKPMGNGSKIVVGKEEGKATYGITKGILTCQNLDHSSDVLQANNTALLEMGDSCFNCMTIDPVGRYWHRSPNIITNFFLRIPDYGHSYRLCLRKINGAQYVDFDGLVDFDAHQMELNGIITYQRLPFILKSDNLDDFRLLAPHKPVPIYESTATTNAANLSFDDHFLFITRFLLDTPDTRDSVSARIGTSHHVLTEQNINQQHQRTHRFQLTPYPDLIQFYAVNQIPHPITFPNASLIQWNSKGEPHVSVYPPIQSTKDRLIQFLQQQHEVLLPT